MKSYWIKERHNPQLGVYYVPMGQMTDRDARRSEDAIYGHNFMHEFSTKNDYYAEIQRLKDSHESVHE